MSRFNRAAGIAGAMLISFFGTVHAGPSRAWEMTPPPPAFLPGPQSPEAPRESSPSEAAPVESPVADPVPAAPPAAEPAPVRRGLADLVAARLGSETSGADHYCLANAVYFESKGESLQGQLSVAEVVLNRSRSGHFPASVCGVVKQRGQFSFVRGGRLPAVPSASLAWKRAVAIAEIALKDLADSPAERALFFHAKRVKPGWRGLRRIASVGNHIFYR
jgi:spore germination cell wall hydrolase CwlJ-like protein